MRPSYWAPLRATIRAIRHRRTCRFRTISRRSRRKDLKRLKVGVPAEYFADGLDPEVEQAVRAAIEGLRELGADIREIKLPTTDAAVATYYVIATAEASSNLARYDGVKFGLRAAESKDLLDMYLKTRAEGFGPEVKRRIMLGTYVLSAGYYDAYYGKAQAVRTLIRQEFEAAFQTVDLIVTPVTPTTGVQVRREGPGSVADVFVGHLHDFGESGRAARHCAALRIQQGGIADRLSVDRSAV